jgi:membrane-anchored protein YejM (alkaline phosphatase superfamily)
MSSSSLLLTHLLEKEYQFLLRGKSVWEKSFFRDTFSSLLQKKTLFVWQLSSWTRKAEATAERVNHFLSKTTFRSLPTTIEKRW